jgi:hypothetical protein
MPSVELFFCVSSEDHQTEHPQETKAKKWEGGRVVSERSAMLAFIARGHDK